MPATGWRATCPAGCSAGSLDEVRALRARGDLSPGLPSMRCVGYRQAWEMFDALEAAGLQEPVAAAMHELRERGIAATRQLAKRQITWLRSMPGREVIACDTPPPVHDYFPPAGGYRVGTFTVPPASTRPPEGVDVEAGLA